MKATRTARRLKGLTLRFWKSSNAAYNYQIENMMTKSQGTYTTGDLHGEDKPKSDTIHFNPISGTQVPDLLFNFTEGIHKQVLASFGETEEVISVDLREDLLGISMKEKQMNITVDLGMILAPDGWLHRGNIRCSFERIE